MKTRLSSIVLVIIFTLFSTTAQFLYKRGAQDLSIDIIAIITNYNIIAGLFLYGCAAAILLFALKNAQLSVIYPFIALSFVWVALSAYFFLDETLSLITWAGILFIVVGVSLVGYGAEHE